MLVPAITFKVRRIFEHVTDLKLLSEDQMNELAQEIGVSIVPMLFSYEVEPATIEEITPGIEAAALKALLESVATKTK